MKPKVTIRGLEDVDKMLGSIAPRQANNIMRATINGVAGQIRNDAKRDMPEDEGDMKAATKSKRRRVRDGWIRSDVLVGKGAFYWRFLEYGQGPDGIEYGFFFKAVERFRKDMHAVFIKQFGKKWEAALRRAYKRQQK